MPHIESKFTLFKVVIELVFMYASESGKPHLTQAPKIFNSINMIIAFCKLIFTVFNSIMALITQICQSIITLQSISVLWTVGLSDNSLI